MQWEYKVVHFEATGFLGGLIDARETERLLCALGAAGWEVCGSFDTNQSHGQTRLIVILLKRPRP